MRKPEPMQFIHAFEPSNLHDLEFSGQVWRLTATRIKIMSFVDICRLTGQHAVAVVETTINE